jgi:uncharacterized protein
LPAALLDTGLAAGNPSRVYYLLYLTERCNLSCAYCENPAIKQALPQDTTFNVDTLVRFLNRDPHLSIWFFGGEPLLRVDLIEELLTRLTPEHVMLQTNGLLLDRLSAAALEKLDVIAVSLDGPPDVTDRGRGAGTYAAALKQARLLFARGFAGDLDVRLTVSPGDEVRRSVEHFLNDCDLPFHAIHWQLNAMFHQQPWGQAKATIRKWFERSYNPGVSALVNHWVAELERGRLLQIVPFARVMHTLLSDEPVCHLRCGAGSGMWAITTNGAVFPCPALRIYPQYEVGRLETLAPADLSARDELTGPCTTCDVRRVCGGRCLYANKQNEWDAEGFALVCDSVKHLIGQLRGVEPRARRAIDEGKLQLEEFARCRDYEVIP